jgi:hypothetical protein
VRPEGRSVNAPALRQWQRSLRYNIDQARADLDKMAANWNDGLLAHQSYTNGRIAEMERALELVEFLLIGEEAPDVADVLDARSWARWPEVVDYAQRHDVDTEDAIRLLVNSGLSHQ